MTDSPIRPFLKWAGGKRALLPEILPRIPNFAGRYIEPFLGAGAVMFAMPAQTQKIVNDFNPDLVEVYETIRDFPTELLSELKRHKNTKEHFLEVRNWDREDDFIRRTSVERAARFIYLNRTCFNGLYRVNAKGQFNVPFGNYKSPDLLLTETIKSASEFLCQKGLDGGLSVEITSGDYRIATAKAQKGDFVYLDPPYDPVNATSSFVAYQSDGFGREDQIALRDETIRLTNLGIPVLLSNADTAFIREIYGDRNVFSIKFVNVQRAISASAASRKKASEVLVSNYEAVR
jgi:DNA adenine methylase